MKLLLQLETINKSAVAITIAQAFCVGYLVPFTTYVIPHFFTSDFVEAGIDFYKNCLTNPAWLYIFFKATLNSGISFSLGALMKTNAFDWFKQYLPAQNPTTITDLSNLKANKTDAIDR